MRIKKSLKMFLASALFASLCTGCGCLNGLKLTPETAYWMLPDSVVINRLGQDLSETIFSPDCVKCYGVSYNDTLTNDSNRIFSGYIRSTDAKVLDNGRIALIQFLLPADSVNYSNDTNRVQSPYIPVMEFAFSKKGKPSASILISPSDHTWQIIQDGKLVFSYNYHNSETANRLYRLLKREENK